MADIAATVTSLVISLFVARRITVPLQQMTQVSERISAGHYAERIEVAPVHANDELGKLAASINALAVALEHTEAGRLRRLVEDLQELSRAEARQIPLSPQSVAPQHLVQSALEPLEGQFAEKGLQLHVQVPEGLPHILADPARAEQILTNLLVNALRYTPAPGKVEVTVSCEGDVVAFRVTDSGIGLSTEQLAHIFERFYRVDKSRSRAFGGSGIGLTIAQSLAQAMGGEIRVESAGLGRGSCFTLTLPQTHE